MQCANDRDVGAVTASGVVAGFREIAATVLANRPEQAEFLCHVACGALSRLGWTNFRSMACGACSVAVWALAEVTVALASVRQKSSVVAAS